MPFILAFFAVQCGAWILGTYVDTQDANLVWDMLDARVYFLPVVVVPTVAAWIGVELAILFRRPRLFVAPWSTRLTRWFVLGMVGFAVGLVSLGVEGVALAINSERIADWWLMGACPFLVCGVAVAALPKYSARRGCPNCGYDWRGLSRCPECGTAARRSESQGAAQTSEATPTAA